MSHGSGHLLSTVNIKLPAQQGALALGLLTRCGQGTLVGVRPRTV